jgi:hypothetical protein
MQLQASRQHDVLETVSGVASSRLRLRERRALLTHV